MTRTPHWRALVAALVFLLVMLRVSSVSAAPPDCSYTTQDGDTLPQIAARYHTTVGAIAAANRLGSLSVLPAGFTLTIPCETSEATSSAPPSSNQSNIDVIDEGGVHIEALKQSPAAPTMLPTAISNAVDRATLQIVVVAGDYLVLGTGTVVGDGWTILTAFHVVGDIMTGERNLTQHIYIGPYRSYTLTARVVATDWANDLAVLRIEPQDDFDGFGSLALADSDAAPLGAPVYIFGYPARQEGGLARTAGRLVAVASEEDGRRDALFTDAFATHGSSGGMAVDANGRVLGIITQSIPLPHPVVRQNGAAVDHVTRFVPVNLARPLLEQARK